MLSLAEVRSTLRKNRDTGLNALAEKAWRFTLGRLRTWFALRDVQHVGFGVRIRGHAPVIRNLGGTIEFGDHVFFDAPVTASFMDVERGAILRIGDDTYLNDGVWLGVTDRVLIGKRVRIAPGVRIIDNPYHELHNRIVMPPSQAVVIDDDVWISSDCIINPGVHIGRGAVIGAHSVVTKGVSPFTVVAGAPAREIRHLDPQQFDRALSARLGKGHLGVA